MSALPPVVNLDPIMVGQNISVTSKIFPGSSEDIRGNEDGVFGLDELHSNPVYVTASGLTRRVRGGLDPETISISLKNLKYSDLKVLDGLLTKRDLGSEKVSYSVCKLVLTELGKHLSAQFQEMIKARSKTIQDYVTAYSKSSNVLFYDMEDNQWAVVCFSSLAQAMINPEALDPIVVLYNVVSQGEFITNNLPLKMTYIDLVRDLLNVPGLHEAVRQRMQDIRQRVQAKRDEEEQELNRMVENLDEDQVHAFLRLKDCEATAKDAEFVLRTMPENILNSRIKRVFGSYDRDHVQLFLPSMNDDDKEKGNKPYADVKRLVKEINDLQKENHMDSPDKTRVLFLQFAKAVNEWEGFVANLPENTISPVLTCSVNLADEYFKKVFPAIIFDRKGRLNKLLTDKIANR